MLRYVKTFLPVRCLEHSEGRGGGMESRRQKEQKSVTGERQAAGTRVFCQISARAPVELNCEICIYFTDRSEAACTWQCSPHPAPSDYTLPCLALWNLADHRTAFSHAGEMHSLARTVATPSGLFNTRLERFSPSLTSEGGRICLIVSVTLAALHKQRQLSH